MSLRRLLTPLEGIQLGVPTAVHCKLESSETARREFLSSQLPILGLPWCLDLPALWARVLGGSQSPCLLQLRGNPTLYPLLAGGGGKACPRLIRNCRERSQGAPIHPSLCRFVIPGAQPWRGQSLLLSAATTALLLGAGRGGLWRT